MDPYLEHMRGITRRHFLRQSGTGIGAIALTALLGRDAFGAPSSQGPHFAPKAKRVIFLHMAGSPPQQDLFEYKPKLNELDGQPCPDDMLAGERFAFIKGHPKILGSPYQFQQHGEERRLGVGVAPKLRGGCR